MTAVRVLVRIELERVTTGLARRVVQDPAATEPDILRLSREEVQIATFLTPDMTANALSTNRGRK